MSKPFIETLTARCFYLPAMFGTSTIDMVNRKKLNMSLATARTNEAAVSLKSSQLISLMISATVRLNALWMFVPPLLGIFSNFLTMCLAPLTRVFFCIRRHNNTASLQRTALTQYAGERQLVGIIA